MHIGKTFYDGDDPQAPAARSSESNEKRQKKLRKEIQASLTQLHQQQVLEFIKAGVYPWMKASYPLEFEPDPVYKAKKSAFLYEVGKNSFGLNASQAEHEVVLEHVAELSQNHEVYFPLECSQDAAESRSVGAPDFVSYFDGMQKALVWNEKIVFNSVETRDKVYFENRLFRARVGDEEKWFRYDEAGKLQPYEGKALAHPKSEKAPIDFSAAIDWQSLQDGVSGIDDAQAFREKLLKQLGYDLSEDVHIDLPELKFKKGQLIRMKFGDGKYEWVYCPAEMFGVDPYARVREQMLAQHSVVPSSTPEKLPKASTPERVSDVILGKIRSLLKWKRS
ncbi:MAG: hypothetical protein AB7J40_04120 [Candidatus Altimarinota bacterium]